MKYLGIDYGTKKIGMAVSDERGKIAFPKGIIKNDGTLFEEIARIINDEGIEKIVIGKSLNLSGSENVLQKDIRSFIKKLRTFFDGEIIEQDERMSSLAAKSHLYGKGHIAQERWSGKLNKKRREAVDAGAAAVILQRYLDRNN